VIHYEEALYQVYAPLPFTFILISHVTKHCMYGIVEFNVPLDTV